MDTGRLSFTLCEAVVEEHSQPEEVSYMVKPTCKNGKLVYREIFYNTNHTSSLFFIGVLYKILFTSGY